MNNKNKHKNNLSWQEKKIIADNTKSIAALGYAKIVSQVSRQRDWMFLISIGLFILLCISVYFNFRWYN